MTQPFKARFGVDANQQKAINVADCTQPLDAVNLQSLQRLSGVGIVARPSDLPVVGPTNPIADGKTFLIRLDQAGQPLNRLVVWRDTTPTPTDPPQGNWIEVDPTIWLKALQSDPDQVQNTANGDLQITTEGGSEEIKAWDGGANAWVKIYGTRQVKAWIAALNLFEGTVTENRAAASRVPGAVQFAGLPDFAGAESTDNSKAAHYFTFVGTPGYNVTAADPNGVGRDLQGVVLNPGDWLQAVNRGTAAAPDMHWVSIGGDLLAKSRADLLFGLQPWADQSWEQGSLVNFNQAIWRAGAAIARGDPQPGAVGSSWNKVDLATGVKTVANDPLLPPAPTHGDLVFVINSARNGGQPGLLMWDNGAGQWVVAGGGGGIPLTFQGGQVLISVGVPVGSITAFAGQRAPAGWLLCDGSTFAQADYPELARALGVTTLPDLRGQFIRGGTVPDNGFVRHQWTTGRPRNTFITSTEGNHQHGGAFRSRANNWKGGDASPGLNMGDDQALTSSAGAHLHTVTGGGDPETAPNHVVMMYIIKASETVAIRKP